MLVFVHQPEYIPWLGFFDKLARCDTFIIYDDAQYQHGGFHNRNKIRTKQGWEWLTVPITHGHPQTIKDIKISGNQWQNRQLALISQNYRKTPYFKQYYPIIEDVLTSNHELLIELDLHLIKTIAKILGINPKMIRSSEFPYFGTEKNEKLISMCKFIGADQYLSGSGGRAYVKEDLFTEANIEVQWHNYDHPIYKQNFEGFQPNMSIIDLLFNMGPQAKEIILKGGTLKTTKNPHRPTLPNPLIATTD
ncbi:MAG: WbqC family protein [Candidatus Bathyarchaeota archaeon]|nr:WbqC family protein [Candidatus Bathyarchaeota archaeon]